MTHKVINHETFQITDKGTVFVVYRDQLENDVSQGDIMEIPDGTKWLVRDIEHYKGSMGYVSPAIGLLVKQIKDDE